MLKIIITDASVSKGYEDNPALRFFNGEGGSGPSVYFRIGKRVYDSRCEENHRWINLNVKAFGDVCERIRKMKLKPGSFVNLIGRYDEEVKEDKDTKETHRYPVVIVEDIEFCYSGSGQKNAQKDGQAGAQDVPPPSQPPAAGQQRGGGAPSQGQPGTPPSPPMPDNFMGYTGLGGEENPYF